MKKPAVQQGFTLIELLVSLLVISIMGIILSSGMNQVTRWYHQLSEEMTNAADLLKTQSVMMNDLLQLAPRSLTDPQGQLLPACLSYADGGFECTRFDSWEAGTGLMRVGYIVDQGTLWRLRWPSIDRAGDEAPIRQQLLTPVTTLSVEWVDATGQGQPQWPPIGEPALSKLPTMIHVTLYHQQQERLHLSFPTSEQQP